MSKIKIDSFDIRICNSKDVRDINVKLISDTKKYSGDVLCSGLKTVFNKKFAID